MKNNILYKIVFILTLIMIMVLLMTIKSNAASLSISTSKSTVAPGESFTVTVSLSNGAGYVSSGGQTQWLDNSSFSYTKTAGSGNVTITASGTAADYSTENDEPVYASKTVKVVQPNSNSGVTSGGNSGRGTNTTKPKEVEKSKDSTLSALSVTEGTISPEFNKDVREYSLNIPYEISAINVVATPTDSKAKVEVIGNTELKEGENTVTVTITAEDGSTSKYLIRVTRARVPLALKSLIVKYTNENGELIETTLNPVFAFDTLEYTLEDLEYWVNNLSIEAIANIEGATVDIQGADSLNTGENTITITLNIKETENIPEGEEPKEETITYTIKVIKKEEPTVLAKISNWFKDIFGGVASWYNNNQEKVIVGALGVCIVALIGLSVYIIVDHNRYKDVIAKAKMERKANKLNTTNVSENIIEEIHKETNDTKKDVAENDKDDKTKNGKHF